MKRQIRLTRSAKEFAAHKKKTEAAAKPKTQQHHNGRSRKQPKQGGEMRQRWLNLRY